MTKAIVLSGWCLFAFCITGSASTKSQLQALVPQVKALAAQSSLLNAVNAENQAHASLSTQEIKTLGKQWRDGLKGKTSQVLNDVNNNALSKTLQKILAQNAGVYEGILVTDSKGLVIGQTYNADHYSQANRSIWRKIGKDGVNSVYYGKAKTGGSDTSATMGLPVIENDKVIGAILVQAKVTPDAKVTKTHKDTKTSEKTKS